MNVAMLHLGDDVHPSHRGFAKAINVDFVSCLRSAASPHYPITFIEQFWNEIKKEIVLPIVVAPEGNRVSDMCPNERLLAHYTQSHHLFIKLNIKFNKRHIGDDVPDELIAWMQAMTGGVGINKNALWSAYTDNLRWGLVHVGHLTEYLSGKKVIISDHGDIFGERASPIPILIRIREWGHLEGIWTNKLVKIPLLEISYNYCKSIISEPGHEPDVETSEQVNERLESLGYL